MKVLNIKKEFMMFDEGTIVYAEYKKGVHCDFMPLNDTGFRECNFRDIEIKKTKDGFSLNGFLVPCYNSSFDLVVNKEVK